MKSTISRLALGVIFVFAFLALATRAQTNESAVPTASATANNLDPATFAAELRRIQGAIGKNNLSAQQIAEVRARLPKQWEVTTPEAHYSISSAPLAAYLDQAVQDPAQREMQISHANRWLDELARQAESYAAPGSPSDSDARAALGQVLARREFSALRAPSAVDRLRDEITQRIFNVVYWFLSHVARHTISATIFFSLLLAAVVFWLGFMLVRFWTRRARFEESQAPQAVPFARSWQEWIRAAREAAERGDFREAVHSTYWAGISYLETVEIIEPDRTRTPREYLRLLAKADPGTATPIERPRAALASLTARLEQVWYGGRPASRQDFLESMQQIEGLGCQLP